MPVSTTATCMFVGALRTASAHAASKPGVGSQPRRKTTRVLTTQAEAHADSGTSVHLFLLGLDIRSLRSFRRKAEPFTDRAELISDDRSGRRATNI